MSFRLKSRLYCGTFWSRDDGRRGSSHVVVFVLWSTKYTRAVLVRRISQPLGRGPSCDTGCCWIVVLFPPAFCPPYILMYCCRLGSTHVVVRVLWSTKYARPSGVCLCSQPAGSSPVPAVVAPVATIWAAVAWFTGFGVWEGELRSEVGELAPVLSSGNTRA
jgi:hypothetical protein